MLVAASLALVLVVGGLLFAVARPGRDATRRRAQRDVPAAVVPASADSTRAAVSCAVPASTDSAPAAPGELVVQLDARGTVFVDEDVVVEGTDRVRIRVAPCTHMVRALHPEFPARTWKKVNVTAGQVVSLRHEFFAAARDSAAAPVGLSAVVPQRFEHVVGLTFLLRRAGDVRVEIFDGQGILVKRLEVLDAAPGRLLVTWDGRDAAGRKGPSGIYEARFQGPDFAGRAPLVRGRVTPLPVDTPLRDPSPRREGVTGMSTFGLR
jgi:hypothetical protein